MAEGEEDAGEYPPELDQEEADPEAEGEAEEPPLPAKRRMPVRRTKLSQKKPPTKP
jgi:hypothetical protein